MNSKLLRSELKEIVKECLVEILAEGLNKDSSSISESRNQRINTRSTNQHSVRKSHLDNIVYNQSTVQEKKKSIKNKVINSNITSSPILNELLADTAASTLQEQIAAEGKRGSAPMIAGDAAAKIVDSSDPSDLFGNSSNKWAALAFS